ncbi:hypothetical protein LUZ60_000323 [Juncus effusus]|nr:hypothetical protein LUZ60_000323 [Juncus effusus]
MDFQTNAHSLLIPLSSEQSPTNPIEMAAPLSRAALSALRSSSQKVERPLSKIPRRSYHVELGAREKALLQEDPALKKFKSCKNTVRQASKIGFALTMFATAACGYQLTYRAMTKY